MLEPIAIIDELKAENAKLKEQILRMMGMTHGDLIWASKDSGKTIDEVFHETIATYKEGEQ